MVLFRWLQGKLRAVPIAAGDRRHAVIFPILQRYLLGNLPWIKQNLSLLIVGIILVSLLPVIIGYLQHRRTA